jgi:hypothetical protein
MLPANIYLYVFYKIYEVEVDVRVFLALALGKDKWSASRPVRLTPDVTAIITLLVIGSFGTRGGRTFQQRDIPLANQQHGHDTC